MQQILVILQLLVKSTRLDISKYFIFSINWKCFSKFY